MPAPKNLFTSTPDENLSLEGLIQKADPDIYPELRKSFAIELFEILDSSNQKDAAKKLNEKISEDIYVCEDLLIAIRIIFHDNFRTYRNISKRFWSMVNMYNAGTLDT